MQRRHSLGKKIGGIGPPPPEFTEFAHAQGYLGRSWGCPALRESVARDVIDRVKGGSLIFAYYPDREWLNASQYLGGCGAE